MDYPRPWLKRASELFIIEQLVAAAVCTFLELLQLTMKPIIFVIIANQVFTLHELQVGGMGTQTFFFCVMKKDLFPVKARCRRLRNRQIIQNIQSPLSASALALFRKLKINALRISQMLGIHPFILMIFL
jgi:hypothetical protein